MSTVNAEVVSAALEAMIEVVEDRKVMPAVRLSILKRRLHHLSDHVENQASGSESAKDGPDYRCGAAQPARITSVSGSGS